jgi:membrane protease subunit HflC
MTRLQTFLIAMGAFVGMLYMSVFVVDERDLVIKFQLREIVKNDFEPGLYWMVPFLNYVRKFDARIQSVDTAAEKYLTSEKKNVIVDAFVKWRISDVAQYYQATNRGDREVAESRLSQIINNALKNQISQRSIKEVISGERALLVSSLKQGVDAEAQNFGISIIDIRIKKLDYSETISESVFERMIKERATVAKKLRSEGQEEAKVIRAGSERQREELLAEAYRESESIRGAGDAKAAEIYAKAFGRNPEFYSFYRSLNAYKESFGNEGDILVMQPDSEFFEYFKNPRGAK